MNIIIESIYRHVCAGGAGGRIEMDKKSNNNIYSIILVYSFKEENMQWAFLGKRLNLRTNLKHYWNRVAKSRCARILLE